MCNLIIFLNEKALIAKGAMEVAETPDVEAFYRGAYRTLLELKKMAEEDRFTLQ
jgi:hypothetical protein